MRNQRSTAPQRGLQGSWAQKYQGPQRAHHIKEILSEKTSHCKPRWYSFYHQCKVDHHSKKIHSGSPHRHCKPHWYDVFQRFYEYIKRKFSRR